MLSLHAVWPVECLVDGTLRVIRGLLLSVAFFSFFFHFFFINFFLLPRKGERNEAAALGTGCWLIFFN